MEIGITGFGIMGPGFNNSDQFRDILFNKSFVLKKENIFGKYTYLGRVLEEDIDISSYPKEFSHLPKTAKMLLHTAREAIKMANIELSKHRTAVLVGSSGGTISEIIKLNDKKDRSPYTIGNMNNYSLSSSLSAAFGLNGMSFTLNNSCTSGMDAIHLAKILLESNQVDVCLVGATDSTLESLILGGFSDLRLLQLWREEGFPHGPFSKGKGFMISEGAGVLVLERADIPDREPSCIYGKITRSLLTQDGLSAYRSDPLGKQLKCAIDYCIFENFPTYINSQALGIKRIDELEAKLYRQKFKSTNIPITSIKGMVGHSMGAIGLFQIVSALISIRDNFIPPTLFCDTEQHPGVPIVTDVIFQLVEKVLITSQGYGGSNNCLMIEKGKS
ncbi:beta-ketoacyl synthase N-terminal-like domain-containing protein [Sutcliffiella rhizosphaerae]|uniref:Actinorhodin polyketide putative beta-ketoacyl synthase 1 n=1 Tax=Sutcliffiella rhizosphaerae TaxID=2880967 RepID=A0ABM8YK41_9BACI|nr:beta-ketoacyl synthase N-terminal-like domain-containing protein [Sutcliffiella rhizosphaerae]CAG9620297.1 Actinorhodin polyketide putative beta-ketoacyl synthase 1 [Sutcliffiella rhizosphaerae]